MTNHQPSVLVQSEGSVRTLTLNRPDVLNAFNNDMLAAFGKAVRDAEKDNSVRCVVISGAGDRRDADIRRQSEILGDAFDEVILYQDQCQRGRADGEVL
ncbi:MAG: enoyl-CoA hydratase/isomerase family protein, partial [Planctomycetota bacterium]